MSRAQAVVNFITGVPGVGKSFSEVRKLVDEVVPDMLHYSDEDRGHIYTNLPLNIDAFVEHFNNEVLREVIVLIPQDELKAWRDSAASAGKRDAGEPLGPWSYLIGRKTQNSALILDEIHELCRKDDKPEYRKRWEDFIATIRHDGFLFADFMTQDEGSVAPCIAKRAGVKISLEDNEVTRDPVFRIPLYDWYNLLASWTGNYKKSFEEEEYKKKGGRWARKPMKSVRRYIKPEYFKFYDSFNSTKGEETQKARKQIRHFEKYSRPRLHFWFFLKNFDKLLFRFGIGCLIVWILAFNGFDTILNFYMGTIKKAGPVATVTEKAQSASEKFPVEEPAPEQVTKTSPEPEQGVVVEPQIVPVKAISETTKPASQKIAAQPAPSAAGETSTVENVEVPVIEEKKEPRVVFVASTYFMTDDGRKFRIGDDYKDKTIKGIDYAEREIIYADDSRLYLYSK